MSSESNKSYTVVEHKETMPPIRISTPEVIQINNISTELQKIWKSQFPEYYTDYVSGQMLGKDNTKASITNILYILFNRLDESFNNCIENNKEFDLQSKKVIQTLYSNQKEALKRILSIYGNEKIDMDMKSIIAFLSGYTFSLLEIIQNTKK